MQRTLSFLFSSLILAACATKAPQGLNRPVSLPEKASAYVPANPPVELAPGLYSRPLFRTDDGPGFAVEVRELLVGPLKKSAEAGLPGPAIMEVRHGSGIVTVGGKPMQVSIGTIFVVPEKTRFTIENRGDVLDLSFRVTTIVAK
jgi:hypothetical protein